jgi:hypothetical protein
MPAMSSLDAAQLDSMVVAEMDAAPDRGLVVGLQDREVVVGAWATTERSRTACMTIRATSAHFKRRPDAEDSNT